MTYTTQGNETLRLKKYVEALALQQSQSTSSLTERVVVLEEENTGVEKGGNIKALKIAKIAL